MNNLIQIPPIANRLGQGWEQLIKGCYPDYFKDQGGRVDTIYKKLKGE